MSAEIPGPSPENRAQRGRLMRGSGRGIRSGEPSIQPPLPPEGAASVERQPSGRINKLVVGYDSGEVKYLEGDEAAKFIDNIDDAAALTQLRMSMQIPAPNWKWVDVKDAGKIFEEPS